jgi:hypothetical protein
MSIKQQAHEIVDQLPEDADWNDLVKALYLEKKITLGMTDIEAVQKDHTEGEVNAIMARLQSASSRPDDMRNTKTYEPGNATTMGMVAGVVAIIFALVFPPISWVAAVLATISGVLGISKKEDKAWVPILLAMVSVGAYATILMK